VKTGNGRSAPSSGTAGSVGGTVARSGARVSKQSTLRQYASSLAVAILMALVFRQFAFQAFRIPSSSMESTLLVGDFLFVNKFLYGAQIPFTSLRLPKLRAPRYGDILVFKAPHDGRDFIKRCVAVAGDTLQVKAKQLYVNGKPLHETFVQFTDDAVRPPGSDPRDFFGPEVIPPDHVFMMGDNRDNSMDSRYWGMLPVQLIKGKAEIIYFSVDTQKGFFPPHLRLSRIGRLIH
jgi:signal peptidase I